MANKSGPFEAREDHEQDAQGDLYELSGDFRGATINIKSTFVGAAEVKELEDLPPEPGESPFKGLQYFEEKDAGSFFGREALTAKIVGRLNSTRFLAILGASGSGKSSLVRAGVIPALRRAERLEDGSFPPKDSAGWDIHILNPSAHPLEALAASLMRMEKSSQAIIDLQEDLAQDSRTLRLTARQVLARGDKSHLLLVVDQFEELFTRCRSADERGAFIENLLSASGRDGEQPVTVIIVLRADFYPHLSQHTELREIVSQNQEYIGAMSREELFRAIVQPAALGDWKIQEGLVEVMLDDIGDEPGALPLLSHALLETWKRRRGRTLTLSGYTESGGVRGAIAQTAEAVFRQRLTPEQQPVARMIFIRLAELGDDSQDTRRRAAFSELITKSTDTEVIDAVLRILIDARLVTTGVVEPGETKVVEVAHEALIREWPTLREWLEANREGLILHRQLTDDTHDWLKYERDHGILYRGARLERALAWARENPDVLSLQEAEFLESSRKVAEEEEQRSERLARAARNQRILVGSIAALALVVVGIILWNAGVISLLKKPGTMQGAFNIAVAEFGLIEANGERVEAPNGAGLQLSEWVADDLEAIVVFDPDEFPDAPSLQVWHDSRELRRQQNVEIGRVEGELKEQMLTNAKSIADRLNADLVIYGDIDARTLPAQITLEFWVSPRGEFRFEEILGNYQIGSPIPVLDPADPGVEVQPELGRQARTIAHLAIGLTHGYLGDIEKALEGFQTAVALSPDSEVVQFFLGREYLFLAGQASGDSQDYVRAAEEAFQEALRINEDYARAYVGLGSVYFDRAQDNLTQKGIQDSPEQFLGVINLIESAIHTYSQVEDLDAGVEDHGVPVDRVAQLGLGISYRLRAEANYYREEDQRAVEDLDRAIQTLQNLPERFRDLNLDRYLTQTYEALGTAYQWRAFLAETQAQFEQSLLLYQQAASYYDLCIEMAEVSPDAIIQQDIVAGNCQPQRDQVLEVLDSFSGGQG